MIKKRRIENPGGQCRHVMAFDQPMQGINQISFTKIQNVVIRKKKQKFIKNLFFISSKLKDALRRKKSKHYVTLVCVLVFAITDNK